MTLTVFCLVGSKNKTMKKIKHIHSSIKVSNIQEYVRNKRIRQSTHSLIREDGVYYHFKGAMIPENVFYEMFPLVLIPVNYKGENCDGTKIK